MNDMGFEFYFTYVLLPIVLSVVYMRSNEKSKRTYKTLKGAFYLYLAIVVIVSKESQYYVTGLTIGLAIMEGLSAITDVIKGSV